MNGDVIFWVALAALFFGVFVSAVRMALSELSPGALRKLETTQPDLAETFMVWYDRRERYRISLRILQVVAIILIVISGTALWRATMAPEAGQGDFSYLAWAGSGALLYLLCTELFGSGLGKVWTKQFLRVGMPVVRVLSLPLIVIVWPLEKWHAFLIRHRLSGESDQEKTTTEDEILSLVEKDEAGEALHITALEEDERRMIRGIFDLDELLVREIMTPRVDLDAVADDVSLLVVKKVIVESGHSRIPVYHGSVDHIVGVIHAKDLLAVEGALEDHSLTDVMHSAIFIPESKNVGDLLEEFQRTITHFGVVVDEYGGTAGVITLEDILEEIVGDIRDEYDHDDQEEGAVIPDHQGDVFDARTTIDDINEALGLELPEDEDFDTLGGYLSFILGHIPLIGEKVRTQDLDVEILDADERRIKKVRLTKVNPDQDSLDTDN
ncbi:MAG: hemolysin family protein [Lentisphaeria bacterium]|nr:hemolysin family protein [Lentisphaeria bacterium]